MAAINKMPGPQDGLIADFSAWIAPACDAPVVYRTFTAVSLLATVIGRNCWTPYGVGRLYPNLYMLLLGPSSLFHKTTVMRFATTALRRLEHPDSKEGTAPSAYLLPNDFSREALIDRIAKQRSGLIVLDEFREFLAVCEKQYATGLKDFVTKTYDGDSYVRELRGVDEEGKPKRVVIQDSSVSILAGCVTDYLSGSLKEDAGLLSGFWARFCLVPAFEKTRYIAPPPPPPDAAAGNRLLKGLNALRQRSGPVRLTDGMRETIGNWSQEKQKEIIGAEDEAVLGAFWSRLETTCLKFALILELSKTPEVQPETISPESLGEAISLVDFLYASLQRLLGRELVESKDMRDKVKILTLVERNPGITRRELLQRSHMLAKGFNPLIGTLLEEGSVKGNGSGYVAS